MTSSGTDTYSAIAGAVGSLKGPLHGGANAKVMEMFGYVKENVDPHDDGSIRDYLVKLLNKEAGDRSGKLYGLGHAVYTISDPPCRVAEEIRSAYGRDQGLRRGICPSAEGREGEHSAASGAPPRRNAHVRKCGYVLGSCVYHAGHTPRMYSRRCLPPPV